MLADAHALVIGIARYQRVPPLRPTQDAQDIAASLQDPDCGGYPPEAVHRLLDEEATRAAILDALDALARTTGPGAARLVTRGARCWRRQVLRHDTDVPESCTMGFETPFDDLVP